MGPEMGNAIENVKKHVGFSLIDEQVIKLIATVLNIKMDQLVAVKNKTNMQEEVLKTIELAAGICSERNQIDLVKNMKEQLPKYFGFEAAGILLRDVKTDFIFTIYELSKDETRKALLQKFKQQEINKRKKLLQKQNKASSEAHNFLETAEYEEREQNYLDQIQ